MRASSWIQNGPKYSTNVYNKIPHFSPKKGSCDQVSKESLILELESTTDKLTHNIKDQSFKPTSHIRVWGVWDHKP